MSARISCELRGRPGLRCWLPSYFLATSSLCQRRSVSGVTMQASSLRAARPFRPNKVKIKDGLAYVEGATVIQRLNDILGRGNWSFQILEGPIQHEKG